jgi:hypothetical protein
MFGKLESGIRLRVGQGLIKKMQQHFVTIKGVELILAMNGFVYFKVKKNINKQ